MKIYIVTVVAWILLHSSSWKTSEAAVTTITLNLVDPSANRYSSFLTAIRDNVRDRTLNYCHSGIDVIGAPSSTDKFLRINFQHPRGTVSLGLRRENLYVVGYVARDNMNVNRAYYFKAQITTTELSVLFPDVEARNQKQLEYGEDYLSLERNAKITTGDQTRKELGLGINLLITSIDGVTMKARVVRDEARFLLIAIQMVAEAARFKYIQTLVNNNFPNKFDSNNKVIQFQVNWSRISKAIYDKNTCQNNQFRTSQNFGFGPVTMVKDLEMGLLTYLGKPSFSMGRIRPMASLLAVL